jgi:2'-5' RNA ligase
VRSIELTFDPAVEAAFRAEWATLERAGLPNLGRHPSTSNRPHLTLAAGAALEPTDALRAVFGPRDSSAAAAPTDVLPVELRMSGLLLFPAGAGRFVLVRPVAVTAALLALHRAVHERVPGAVDLTLPGRWTPHVTLARRLNATQVAEALGVLGEPPPGGHCVAARFWNGETATLTALTPEGNR